MVRFQIFDVETAEGNLVVDCMSERTKGLRGLIPIYYSSRFISCSDSGIVCLWSLVPSGAPSLDVSANSRELLTNVDTIAPNQGIVPFRHAKMQIHAGPINNIIPLSEYSFATCGEDGYVVLWKVSETDICKHN